MKNKKLSWILLPVVVVVWAMIGWKVYAALTPEDTSGFIERTIPAPADSLHVPDTYQLSLNYRDPFLDLPAKQTTSNKTTGNKGAPKQTEPVPVPPQKEFPKIQYYGLVKETGSAKTVAFLKVDGETHFVKQRDLINGITVLKIWADSVELSFESEKLVIRK